MQTSCGVREEMYRPVLPGEKIRVAFLFQVPSQWGAWESLYFYLLNDGRFEVRLYLVKDKVDKSKQQDTAGKFLRKRSLEYKIFDDKDFQKFAPHIVLLQTPYEYSLREFHLYARSLTNQGIRIVYIPYGIELADTKSARHDHFRRPLIKLAWRIYTASDEFAREYDKYCENAKAVRGLGLPRFDLLKRRDRFNLPADIKNRVGDRKIVVWHVHFCKKIDVDGEKKQVTPYLEEYVKFAENIHKWANEFFFIFMPHPLFADDAVDLENNRKSQKVIDTLNKQENVYIDISDDYRPSLLNADAIISDRSSLAVEASTLRVPILYMKNPDYEEKIFPPLASIFQAYEQGYEYEEMRRFVEMLSRGELDTSEYLDLPNCDGKCAERIANDIVSSLFNNNISIKRNLKLIMFGIGFIYETMYQLMSKQQRSYIVALVDNNKDKWGKKIDGIEVIPPTKINDYIFDKVVICSERVFADEIEEQLLYDLEIPKNKVEHCDYLAVF